MEWHVHILSEGARLVQAKRCVQHEGRHVVSGCGDLLLVYRSMPMDEGRDRRGHVERSVSVCTARPTSGAHEGSSAAVGPIGHSGAALVRRRWPLAVH